LPIFDWKISAGERMAIPALVTKILTFPNSSRFDSPSARHSSDRSHHKRSAGLLPLFLNLGGRLLKAREGSTRHSHIRPWTASPMAAARPNPPDPPVTIATLPVRSKDS